MYAAQHLTMARLPANSSSGAAEFLAADIATRANTLSSILMMFNCMSYTLHLSFNALYICVYVFHRHADVLHLHTAVVAVAAVRQHALAAYTAAAAPHAEAAVAQQLREQCQAILHSSTAAGPGLQDKYHPAGMPRMCAQQQLQQQHAPFRMQLVLTYSTSSGSTDGGAAAAALQSSHTLNLRALQDQTHSWG